MASSAKSKEYAEMANIFERVINVIDHFETYNHIEQIADLSTRVKTIKQELSVRIKKDFEESFATPFTRVILYPLLWSLNSFNLMLILSS